MKTRFRVPALALLMAGAGWVRPWRSPTKDSLGLSLRRRPRPRRPAMANCVLSFSAPIRTMRQIALRAWR